MSDREIEIKVAVEHTDALVAFLEAQGTFLGEERQVDTYYTPAHRDFVAVDPVVEWLRVREEAGTASMTYKHWIYGAQGVSNSCDEYETAVGDATAVRKILAALDVRELVRVDKRRRAWRHGAYEIAIDQVVGLGEFVEVEYKDAATHEDAERIAREMEGFLTHAGVGAMRRDHRGYPYLLLFPEG